MNYLLLLFLSIILVSCLPTNKSADQASLPETPPSIIGFTKAGTEFFPLDSHQISLEVTQELMLGALSESLYFTGSIGVTDINGDNYPDFYVTYGHLSQNKFFINEKGKIFSEQSAKYQLNTSGGLDASVIFSDLDQDGDDELVVSRLGEHELGIYELVTDKYEAVANQLLTQQKNVVGIAIADIDHDSDLDISTTRWYADNSNHLIWEQTGPLLFESSGVSSEASNKHNSLCGDMSTFEESTLFMPNFIDINNDFKSDLLISGDFASSRILLNTINNDIEEPDSSDWSDISIHSALTDCNAMGSTLGDYDNDGDMDWFVSSIKDPNGIVEGNWGIIGNRLYENNGDSTFSDVSTQANITEGFWGWGSCLADFNNDGYLDIFHVNGFIMSPEEFSEDPSRLFISNKDKTFTEMSLDLGINDTGQGRGISCADVDLDGAVDILVINNKQTPALYKNNLPDDSHFIHLRIAGLPPVKHSIGAKVKVITDISQTREVRVANNFLGQQPRTLHIGLGSHETIKRIEVSWPPPISQTKTYTNIPSNQFLVLSPNPTD